MKDQIPMLLYFRTWREERGRITRWTFLGERFIWRLLYRLGLEKPFWKTKFECSFISGCENAVAALRVWQREEYNEISSTGWSYMWWNVQFKSILGKVLCNWQKYKQGWKYLSIMTFCWKYFAIMTFFENIWQFWSNIGKYCDLILN